MKIDAKLSKKYATHSVMLPPPPEENEELELEPESDIDSESFKAHYNLPSFEDPDLDKMEQRMFIYDRDQPILEKRKLEEADRLERQKRLDEEFNSMEMSGPSTVPPPRARRAALSADKLLKLCAAYYQKALA